MDITPKSIPKLCERLKYIRVMADMTQAEMASALGVTQQAIQQAETGKARAPRYLHKLSLVTGLPFEWVALNEMPSADTKIVRKQGLSERETELLERFKKMNTDEQNLILNLVKSRTK